VFPLPALPLEVPDPVVPLPEPAPDVLDPGWEPDVPEEPEEPEELEEEPDGGGLEVLPFPLPGLLLEVFGGAADGASDSLVLESPRPQDT
jgi:hypothetical protein